jgi:TATA-box binding protein (TBP) (component of TFIID and TFIIIB)
MSAIIYDEEEFLKKENEIMLMMSRMKEMMNVERPEPSKYKISTHSAMCTIGIPENSKKCSFNLSLTIEYISKEIISNIVLRQNPNYQIVGIVVDNLIIRYDDSYLKRYKYPYIKHLSEEIDCDNIKRCSILLDEITFLENKSLKNQGRMKKKKEMEHFYNSCSIIVKPYLGGKSLNIKLFNNGNITLTGSEFEMDGYYAVQQLLVELKKKKEIFQEMTEEEIESLNVLKYKITMINSDFNTYFKIDLNKLLDTLKSKKEYEALFWKFNPEKYRGLIIGYFFNEDEDYSHDGICHCTKKCKGKGGGKGNGECKKVTISIFKSGSIIITGGRTCQQIDMAYDYINTVFEKNYRDILKVCI